MIPILKQSLMYQSECPNCGMDWEVLRDSLHQEITSFDYLYARSIIDNCSLCKIRFQEEVSSG